MVIPSNNGGAGFLLAYSCLLMLYSLMLWFIFYKIPSQFGLISKYEDHIIIEEQLLLNEAMTEHFIKMK